MIILETLEQHEAALVKLAQKKPKRTSLATFGLFAGITHTGRDYHDRFPNAVRNFLEALKEAGGNVRVMVGTGPYKSCKPSQCVACERNYVQLMIRLLNHAETYPGFEWRTIASCHLKMAAFEFAEPVVVTGGRNMTNSGWPDVSFVVQQPGAAQLLKIFERQWAKTVPLDDAAINAIFAEQKISAAGLEAATV